MNPNSAELKSFVESAQGSPFPIQNLPYGVFSHKNAKHIGVAIGDSILDLTQLERDGIVKIGHGRIFDTGRLNEFMAQGRGMWAVLRQQVSELLRHDNSKLKDNRELRNAVLIEQEAVEMLMPCSIGDYTDFYSSEQHARNVGAMFRDKNNPLLPNWKHLPVGYHGRASSVVVSGTDIVRPRGQIKADTDPAPRLAATQKLDFELEVAFLVGKDSTLGRPVGVDSAEDYVFGLVLMNDWSARDIQKWEYVPLGPFVSKSFGTSISPWVVSLDALQSFRIKGAEQDPRPLPYLRHSKSELQHFDIRLSVSLKTHESEQPYLISMTNARNLYWSIGQQLAHHTITGCNLRIGDLIASGTISGNEHDSYGSLLELTQDGAKPLKLGEEPRSFLQDHDTVTITGWCQGKGYKIGFGEVSGTILPALS